MKLVESYFACRNIAETARRQNFREFGHGWGVRPVPAASAGPDQRGLGLCLGLRG